MSYTLHIKDAPGGRDLIRTDGRVKQATFAYDKHGCADLTTLLDIPRRVAFQLYDQAATPFVSVCYYGAPIWAGRLMEPTINNAGARLVAAGYWDSLKDAKYTGLWSKTSTTEFYPAVTTEIATAFPDRYAFDNNNRIYMTASKGAIVGTTTTARVAYYTYQVPSQSVEPITNVSFDYSFSSQNFWRIGLASYNDDWSGTVSEWTLNGAGAGTVTGSVATTFATPHNRIAFFLFYNAGDAVVVAETGDIFARFTNIRIKTTTSSTVLGSEIASGVNAYAASVNPILAASYVTASTLDLKDEQYEDMTPAEIIEHVATIDGVRAFVDENRVFWYGALAFGVWQLDAADLEIQRPLDRVYNSVYAVYQDANSRNLRTAAAVNTFSTSRYGLTRSQALAVQSTSSSQATSQRDTALSDTANPAPRAGITIRRILDSQGRPALAHQPRPGDLAILPALPAGLTASADQIRSFIIERVEVTLEPGKRPATVIEPSQPIPNLVTMLARIEAT